jgi:hypothetical protein
MTTDSWAEYDEMLGYDADHTDDSQYCRHGTFIGSWWGPDYLCQWCELGEEPPTLEEIEEMRIEGLKVKEAEFDRMVASVTSTMRSQGYRYWTALAQGIYDLADNYYFSPAQELYH